MFSEKLLEGIDFKSFPIEPNDIIVATIDMDIWDLDAAQSLHDILVKVFPTNTVVITFKGVDIEIAEDH